MSKLRATASRCITVASADFATTRSLRIATKGGGETTVDVDFTRHGPLLESLMNGLGRGRSRGSQQTALRWALADAPTSAGALARLPLAKTTEEFGNFLFEDDVCPLVNNIIAALTSHRLLLSPSFVPQLCHFRPWLDPDGNRLRFVRRWRPRLRLIHCWRWRRWWIIVIIWRRWRWVIVVIWRRWWRVV